MRMPMFGKIHAPALPDGLVWLNSAPLTMEKLRGKPVLIDFWTYSCVNCLRTIPHVQEWHEKYQKSGLTVIGVHSPEFDFEKDEKNVARAIEELGITYPVVLDPHFAIWNLYANKYWPHVFLVDHRGVVVYDHAGEGAVTETEHAIASALQAAGAKKLPAIVAQKSSHDDVCYRPTPETYLGYLRGHIGNAGESLPETEESFTDLGKHENDVPYLHGHWRISGEYIEHTRSLAAATEYLALKYHAFSVNLVLGALDDREAVIDVTLDGKPVPSSMMGKDLVVDRQGNTHLHVTTHRMYAIIDADHFHDAALKLSVKNAGVKCYAFTFGGCSI